jgi:hypothetical protein
LETSIIRAVNKSTTANGLDGDHASCGVCEQHRVLHVLPAENVLLGSCVSYVSYVWITGPLVSQQSPFLDSYALLVFSQQVQDSMMNSASEDLDFLRCGFWKEEENLADEPQCTDIRPISVQSIFGPFFSLRSTTTRHITLDMCTGC